MKPASGQERLMLTFPSPKYLIINKTKFPAVASTLKLITSPVLQTPIKQGTKVVQGESLRPKMKMGLRNHGLAKIHVKIC